MVQLDISQLPNLFCALEAHDVLPFARLSKPDSSEASRAIEAGAAGIIFPNDKFRESNFKSYTKFYMAPKW